MYCGIAFRLRSREAFPRDGCCDVGVVCAGKDGENLLPRVSNSTLQAALLSSNKTTQ